jgi:hypothetical protein
MPFWQRSLITLAAMLAVSFIIGYMWRSLFGFALALLCFGCRGRSDGDTSMGILEAGEEPIMIKSVMKLSLCLAAPLLVGGVARQIPLVQ